MHSAVASLLGALRIAERAILALGFVVMTTLLLIDTLGRELFASGFFGANIYATYVLIFAAMAGFGLATSTGAHLRPQVVDHLVPPALESTAARAGHLATFAIGMLITWASIRFVLDTYGFDERNDVVHWPLWPIQLALPLGFGLSALRHLCYAIWPDLAPAEKDVEE